MMYWFASVPEICMYHVEPGETLSFAGFTGQVFSVKLDLNIHAGFSDKLADNRIFIKNIGQKENEITWR